MYHEIQHTLILFILLKVLPRNEGSFKIPDKVYSVICECVSTAYIVAVHVRQYVCKQIDKWAKINMYLCLFLVFFCGDDDEKNIRVQHRLPRKY